MQCPTTRGRRQILRHKTAKCANLGTQFLFQPIAVESLGPMHESARLFLVELGHKIAARSGDDREGSFCFSAFHFCCTAFSFVAL